MPSIQTLAAFVLIVAVFAAVPGPSNMFVVARGLKAGRRSALAAAAGCALGSFAYVTATAFGLAALLASSTVALTVVHYVGGAYLIWLGVRALRQSRNQAPPTSAAEPLVGRGRSVAQGFLVELGNPKVALFFLAFFPQFVHLDRGPAWSQVLILGAVFCSVGLISDSLYAFGSGSLNARLQERTRWLRRSHRASGILYLGLGAWALASGSSTHPDRS